MQKNEYIKKEKKLKKGEKGITLIALVITIIVLLILAGVTISTLTGEERNIRKNNKCKRRNRDCKRKREIIISGNGIKNVR